MKMYIPALYRPYFAAVLCFSLAFGLVPPLHTALPVAAASHPDMGDEFVGPFPSWINVKTAYGAVGDGVADDTVALQRAMDAASLGANAGVIYIPAGTYRITNTLNLKFNIYISLIGEHPDTTTIRWDGPSAGTMIHINGVAYSRFNRLTWDGNGGRAKIAVNQSWDASRPSFDTANEYTDSVFKDVGVGIYGGFLGHGFAETAVLRSKFIRNSIAGVSTGNFNALDLWIWDSVFEDCAIGVTNIYGAGAFFVYNSIFRNSTTADMRIAHTQQFAARNNTSINSKAFFVAGFSRNPNPTVIQGNTIIDPINTAAIVVENHGPITVIDNTFRSRIGATGPVVYHAATPNNELIAIDNVFTVPNPIKVGSASRLLNYGTRVVSRKQLMSLQEHKIPGFEAALPRPVIEIPVQATTAVIQEKINQASLYAGKRPIVHFPKGNYNITATLRIPRGSDIQLVGDDFRTTLKWTGGEAGIMIQVDGPTKASIRNMYLDGNKKADGIVVTNADQVGSRVFVNNLEARTTLEANVFIEGLDNTEVYFANSGFFYNTSGVGIKITGGPRAAAGARQAGKTVIYGSTGSSNVPQMQVTNGGSLHIRDYWYENDTMAPFVNLSGAATFTMEGSRVYSLRNTPTPIIDIANFTGKATFINSKVTDRIAVRNIQPATQVLGLGMAMQEGTKFMDISPSSMIDTSRPQAQLLLSREVTQRVPSSGGSIPIPNIGGAPQESFIRDMLASIRSINTPMLTPTPSNVTDFRMFRVWVINARKGVHVQRGGISKFDGTLNQGILQSDHQPQFTVDAGETQTINLPQTTAVLSGAISGEKIARYQWGQTDGPAKVIFKDEAQLTTTVANMTNPGTYMFSLEAISSTGMSARDSVSLTVLPSIKSESAETAQADISSTKQ